MALLLFPAQSMAANLTASLDDGTVIADLSVDEGGAWCVLWRHSVRGFEVTDCYLNQDGKMVLDRSHWPDVAAGLDHIPGRGRQISDGQGGYWIVELNEPVPGNAYILRTGNAAVDHRLQVGDVIVSLSSIAPHARVKIALTTP